MQKKVLCSAVMIACCAFAFGCAKKTQVAENLETPAAVAAPVASASADTSSRQSSASDLRVGNAQMGMNTVHFEFDSYVLSEESKEILRQNAQWMKANPGANIVIEGHCDERGSDEYNMALGENRARAASNYLVSLGVAPESLRIVSYGEEKPVAMGANEAAWAQNRRAEFK
ncbi:peptidoglycan-associated lipoprotein Pal [Trichloromonas sp.]|uniref:peptidoglycan-associated lipoprotein Pal n=1 Tax=Trichloromonas sp. TaxID=3069249 RepID=UPI002A4C8D9F|nr:peptidoglycan-associated lipoprotein Pal [Trichloromonas sp.]